jgi:hypothetical protein
MTVFIVEDTDHNHRMSSGSSSSEDEEFSNRTDSHLSLSSLSSSEAAASPHRLPRLPPTPLLTVPRLNVTVPLLPVSAPARRQPRYRRPRSAPQSKPASNSSSSEGEGPSVPQTRLRRLNSDEIRSMQLFQPLSSPIQGVGDRRGPSDEERLPTAGVESVSDSVRDDDEVLGGYGSDISIQIRDDGQDFDLGGHEDFIYDGEAALRAVGPPPPGQRRSTIQ